MALTKKTAVCLSEGRKDAVKNSGGISFTGEQEERLFNEFDFVAVGERKSEGGLEERERERDGGDGPRQDALSPLPPLQPARP